MIKIKLTLTVVNKLGLHARPATQLASLASTFTADIIIEKDGKQASAYSVLGIMMLEASQNKEVEVICEGEDAEKALDAVTDLFSAKFNESE